MIRVPIRYLPTMLTRKDKLRQVKSLLKSRKLYKLGKYFLRPKVASFKSTKSKHLEKAQKLYKVDNVTPNKKLASATGCSLSALNKIVKKGEGAYYSSGSRPNQTPKSWGLARLASAITGGKASAVDFNIIEKGCSHNKPAFKLAKKSLKKYNYGRRKTRRVFF